MEYQKLGKTFENLFNEIGKVVLGQKGVVEQIMVAMLTDNNALLEGYPGLGKTMMIRTIAEVMDLKFSRIQFTPDLMPSDITGTQIIEEVGGKRFFKFQPGPIFANIVLGDEINRATPKTQSAMLEAMQEKQVTVANKTYALDQPFFVLATQNPIEQEGTYPLPEAQADRFLLKIKIGYPKQDEELKILERYAIKHQPGKVKKIIGKNSLTALQEFARQVPVANDLKKRALKITHQTRTKTDLIEYGASPRGTLALILSSKARALIKGRNHVSEKDLKAMAYPVLRHRIILNFESERKGLTSDDVIKEIVEKV